MDWKKEAEQGKNGKQEDQKKKKKKKKEARGANVWPAKDKRTAATGQPSFFVGVPRCFFPDTSTFREKELCFIE